MKKGGNQNSDEDWFTKHLVFWSMLLLTCLTIIGIVIYCRYKMKLEKDQEVIEDDMEYNETVLESKAMVEEYGKLANGY
jgi:heme/copper-type cytochrome/quinol oxidase subunit 2